ncbi:ribbon-helix-helix domain-containing protein [Yersinia mollaretii]|uniref:ribbon-helix-helix domain-containing protein n=1 Tax=Yersinia mollaretii TaxID=33060 RepID=UPI0011A0AA7A|nr:type II toxin-antitoxin system ParD family antitoxin [Yersinia mollaretii]
MARTTRVTMSEQLDSIIRRLIESGRYRSTSEVVRQAVIDGLESGESLSSLRDIAAQRKLKHRV